MYNTNSTLTNGLHKLSVMIQMITKINEPRFSGTLNTYSSATVDFQDIAFTSFLLNFPKFKQIPV